VGQVLRDLHGLQQEAQPPFRVVLHYGQITIGGIPSSGEDSLAGPEVNLVFRLEQLSKQLQIIRLASAAATRNLGSLVAAKSAGAHMVAGFSTAVDVFAFECALETRREII
jgi:class 3 adenylate cyclase